MDVSWKVYISLSLVMFFEYAVWGAWAPVLAARLLGPLKMTGKQTGWIYTTLPIACIISPLIAGQLADRYLNLEWILAGAHLIAAILMFVAMRQKKFAGLFAAMLGWSLCYAATMPLVNSVLFRYVSDGAIQGKVFIWAPVAWALVGYSLSGFRMLRKAESDGTDAMIFSAVLGLVMVACCLMLPTTPPKSEKSLIDALSMLRQGDFLVFIVASLCVAGTMQFYFLGSGQYMMDRGISGKAVPGAMAMAQAAQAVATWYCAGLGDRAFWIQVDADGRLGLVAFALRHLHGERAATGPFRLAGAPRHRLCNVHNRYADLCGQNCSGGSWRIHARPDLCRYDRRRAVLGHAACRFRNGQAQDRRQVPMAKDLGISTGHYAPRHIDFRSGVSRQSALERVWKVTIAADLPDGRLQLPVAALWCRRKPRPLADKFKRQYNQAVCSRLGVARTIASPTLEGLTMRGVVFSLRLIIPGVALAVVGAAMMGSKELAASAGWRLLIGGLILALVGVYVLIRTMQDSGKKGNVEGAGSPDKNRE